MPPQRLFAQSTEFGIEVFFSQSSGGSTMLGTLSNTAMLSGDGLSLRGDQPYECFYQQ